MTTKQRAEIGDTFKSHLKENYKMFNRVIDLIKKISIEKYTQQEFALIVGQIYIDVLKEKQND
tara:strand:+ start:355 stop:543 length:189 start_codon:yes stop_codon:yes gene_type:complete